MRNKLWFSLGCLMAALVFSPALRASSSICDSISGNLVTNCGFEASNDLEASSITGWTLTPAAEGSDSGVESDITNSGSGAFEFGAEENDYDTLSQSIATINGQSYTLSFYLFDSQGDGAGSDTDFQALWDGSSLLDQYTTTDGFVEYSYTVTGGAGGDCIDGCSDTLTFEGYNNPSWYYLDDVSLTTGSDTETPEPSSFLLLGSGLVGLAGMLRRRFV